MLFWDSTANYRRKCEISTANPQLCLSWSAPQAVLYTGSTKGDVHLWVYKDGQWRNTSVLKGHEDMVMDIVHMGNTTLMASGSLDSKIILWDVNTGSFHQEVKGHSKGVLSLAYEPEHRLLFSSGFDRDVLVWNPWILGGTSSDSVAYPLVFRLKGHHTSPITLKLVTDGSGQVVSADADGVFKVWDVRRLECVQTFQTSEPGLVSFTYAAASSQIIAGTRLLHTFQWDRPGKPWLTSSQPVLAALYSELSGTILTAAGRDLRIWDAEQGTLLRSYNGVTPHKISAVCLDGLQRKVIVGTTKGQIALFNYNNGALLRELEPHGAEVSALVYAGGKTVISASWDSKVNVHNELLQQQQQHLHQHQLQPPPAAAAAAGTAAAHGGTMHLLHRQHHSAPTLLQGGGSGSGGGGGGGSVVRSAQCSAGGQERDALCLVYSHSAALFACAFAGGGGAADSSSTVRLWDFDSASSEHHFRLDHEVTCLLFAEPYPLLLAADGAGSLHFCTVRPAPLKNRLLCSVLNVAGERYFEDGQQQQQDALPDHQPVGPGLPPSVRLPLPTLSPSPSQPAAAAAAVVDHPPPPAAAAAAGASLSASSPAPAAAPSAASAVAPPLLTAGAAPAAAGVAGVSDGSAVVSPLAAPRRVSVTGAAAGAAGPAVAGVATRTTVAAAAAAAPAAAAAAVAPGGDGVPVQAMAFCAKHQLLVTGDEHGMVKVWNCARLLAKANLTPTVRDNSRVRRRAGDSSMSYQAAAAKASAGNNGAGGLALGSAPIGAAGAASIDGREAPQPQLVELCLQWHAHAASISSLQIMQETFVLSASHDRRVRSWDLAGGHYGTLRQAADARWNLPLLKTETRHSAPAVVTREPAKARGKRNAKQQQPQLMAGSRRLSLSDMSDLLSDSAAAAAAVTGDDLLLPSIVAPPPPLRRASSEAAMLLPLPSAAAARAHPGGGRLGPGHHLLPATAARDHTEQQDDDEERPLPIEAIVAMRRRSMLDDGKRSEKAGGPTAGLLNLLPAINMRSPAGQKEATLSVANKEKKDDVSFSTFLSDMLEERKLNQPGGKKASAFKKKTRQAGQLLFDKLSQLDGANGNEQEQRTPVPNLQR